MINVGCKIGIVDSEVLRNMSLEGLIGMCGVVVEDLSSEERKNKGCLVQLDEVYLEEDCWFVPVESVRYEG